MISKVAATVQPIPVSFLNSVIHMKRFSRVFFIFSALGWNFLVMQTIFNYLHYRKFSGKITIFYRRWSVSSLYCMWPVHMRLTNFFSLFYHSNRSSRDVNKCLRILFRYTLQTMLPQAQQSIHNIRQTITVNFIVTTLHVNPWHALSAQYFVINALDSNYNEFSNY
jgi:hypothetical protein